MLPYSILSFDFYDITIKDLSKETMRSIGKLSS